MSFLKKPLSKNLCLSLTGKEPFLNSSTVHNDFPIGLMIISKLDQISARIDVDKHLSKEQIEELEVETKLKYINQHARDLFELKDNDSSSKISEQLKQFKLSDKNKSIDNKNENLYNILLHQEEEKEYYGSFRSQSFYIWVKFVVKKEDIYISADYFSDDRKVIQNELFQSIKFQYIATLFHELYNPINAILVMMEQNKYEEDIKSNLDYQLYTSEIVGTHYSLITDNEFDKFNYNLNIGDNNNNIINDNNQNSNKDNEYLALMNKYEKCLKLGEFYKNNYNNLKEKEKDVRLLVNIIYIFLQNLILYLRLNLGDGKDGLNEDISENKLCWISEDNSEDKNDNNRQINKTFLKQNKIENKNSKSDDKAKTTIRMNNDNTRLYQDNYLNSNKANKKLNLEMSFRKHLKKFSYLFKFKNIDYFKDFSFLSNKYIFTDEHIFSDFIGQIYSFLYYVVPKCNGFNISFNIVSENKIKLTFEKANYKIKTGYTHKKFQKKDSFILLDNNKFSATNTVKTTEMIIEILQKLSKILDINLKIMDYQEKKEEKYLTILMPFYPGKDIHANKLDRDSSLFIDPEDVKIDESLDGNIIFENTLNNLENIDMVNLEKEKFEEELRNKTNKIIENINTRIITNNDLRKSSKKVCFQGDDKDIINRENNNLTNNKTNINSVNINISINKNININNNFNTSSASSILSNTNKNFSHKTSNENYLSSPKNKPKSYFYDVNNAIKHGKDKSKNLLTLIHEKYSFIDRLKNNGVEILTEKKDKSCENEYIPSERKTKPKSNDNNNSLNAEADSENYYEIENVFDIVDDKQDDHEEIIFNNNFDNINLQISDDHPNDHNNNNYQINIVNNSNNDSFSIKSNQNTSIIKSKKEKINSIRKPKKSYLSTINKNYNKTLSFNQVSKDSLFVIPEIIESNRIEKINIHPSCKINTKIINEFSACECHDILLVDDDEFICKTFKNILNKFKLQADCAENGQECIKMIKDKIEKNCGCSKSKYKIIFMDITMPVMDGIEAAKKIQEMIDKNEMYDSIKIIFISAHANLDLSGTISGIKCAVDYYAKPITADKYKHLLDKYYYNK